MRFRLLVLCLVAGQSVAEDYKPHVIETRHYRVYAPGSREDAEEMGRILEGAWPQFLKFFVHEPKPTVRGEKLVVRVFDEWWRYRKACGGEIEAGIPAIYRPETGEACVWRRAGGLALRLALLHEAAHQFHYLASRTERALDTRWYIEGLAEYLASHTWVEGKLVLGVTPTVSGTGNLDALRRLKQPDFQFSRFVYAPKWDWPNDYALAGSLVRYLRTGNGGKPLEGFAEFAARMDGRGPDGPIFLQTLGRTDEFLPGFVKWLEEHKETWTGLRGAWQIVEPGHMLGASDRGNAVCHPNRPVTRISATVGVGGGLLLHLVPKKEHAVAHMHADGKLRAYHWKNGKWYILEARKAPKPAVAGRYRIVGVRAPQGVEVTVEGERFGPWKLPEGPMGLSVRPRHDSEFRDVRWK